MASLLGSPRPDDSQGIANVQFEDGNSIVKTLPACVVCIPPDEESLRNVLYLLDDVHNIKYFAIGPWFEDVRPERNSFTKVTIWCNRFRKKDTPEKFEIVHSDFLRIVNEKFINFFVLPLWSDARKREVKSDFLKEWSSRIVLCKTPKDICEFYHEFSFFGFKKEQLGTKREQRIRRSFRKRLSSSELENSLFKYNGFRINWNLDGTACYMKDIDYKTLMNCGIISLLERKRPDHYKVVGCYIKNQGNQIKIYSLLSEDPFSVHVVERKRLPEILANTPSQPASNGSIEPLPVNSTRCHPGSNTEPNSLEASVRPSQLPISPARDVSRTPLSPPLSPPPPPPPPEQTATPQRVVTDSGQPVDRTGQHGSAQRVVTDSGQPAGRTGQHGSPQSLDGDSGQPVGRTGQNGSLQMVNTDSGQPEGRTGQHGSPQRVNTDSGQPVGRTGQHGSPQRSNTDSGQPVGRTGQHGSPQRVNTDSDQPVDRTGQHVSPQRVFTDSGQPVGRTGQHGSPQRVGTDSGQSVGRTGQHGSPQRMNTDSGQPVGRTGQHGSPQRSNTDSGQPVGRTGQHGSPQRSNTDSGQPVGRTGQHGSPQRVNTDSDQPVDRTGQHVSPQRVFTDSGQPVGRTGQHGSPQRVGTDSGQPVGRTGQHGSPQRSNTDSGQPVGRTGQHGSPQRVNTDSDQPVDRTGQHVSPQRVFTDSGQPVGRTGQHGSPQRVFTDSGQPVGRTGQHGSPQRSNTDSGQPVSNPAQHSSQQGPEIVTSQSVDNSGQHVNVTVTLNMNGSSHSINANSGRPVSSPGQHDFHGESSSFNERGTVSNQPRQQSSTLRRPSQSRSNGDVERASYGSWPRRIYPQHAARRSFIEENFEDLLLNLSPRVSVDWRTLGGHLRLEPYELSNIDDEYRRTEDKAYQMLLKWKQKNGRAATPQVLVAALRATGRNDLRDIVQEFAITGRYNIND